MAHQARWNPDTGELTSVAVKLSERTTQERQGSLLDWGEDQQKAAAWAAAAQQLEEEQLA